MHIMTQHDVVEYVARTLGKPCLYVSFGAQYGADYDYTEICKAAPYLSIVKHGQALIEGRAIIVCESEDEAYELFNQTVGNDGPTPANPYDGNARVYACIYSADGEPQTENT